MELGVWTIVGAVAGVLALLGLVIGVITYRRQFPKRELRYEVEVFPLLRGEFAHPASGLTVLLDGRAIPDPHVVRVKAWSQSRADIPSASFDGGDAIEFASTTPIVTTGWTARSDKSIGFELSQSKRTVTGFKIPSQLIRRGASGALAGVAEGKPVVTIARRSLIDIDVKDVSRPQESSGKGFLVTMRVAFFALLTAGVLVLAVTIADLISN